MKPKSLGTMMVIVCATLTAFAASASDGRIPVYQVPTTIAAPGSYYLTQDLDGSAFTGEIVSIRSNNVTLDLNGHVIVAGNSATGVGTNNGQVANVRLTNGTIAGGDSGVTIRAGAGSVVVDNLRMKNQISSGIRIEATSPGDAPFVAVRDNIIGGPVSSGSALAGIYLSGPGVTGGLTVTGNTLLGSQGNGIAVMSAGNAIVAHNSVSSSRLSGIYVFTSSAVAVSDNVCSGGVGHGIYLSNSTACRLERNTCSHNGVLGAGNGIYLINSDRSDIRDNSASWNGSYGIFLDTGSHMNRIGYNAVSANSSGIVLNGANNNTLDWNYESGGWWGLSVTGSGNIYSNNRAPGNTIAIADGGGNTNGGGNF